jgi:periplasmic protein CpxP/Spy
MPSCSLPIPSPARFTRAVAIAALMGATVLAGSLSAANAATVTPAPVQLAQATAPQAPAAPQTPATQTQAAPQAAPQDNAAAKAEEKAETVEQRITDLHAALQITSQEESKWTRVAQVMRDNAAAMQKLASDKANQASEGMTAVEDLRTYEKFAQAHVAGLRKLTTAFDTLYNSMPAAQKKVADEVFQDFGHKAAASHS